MSRSIVNAYPPAGTWFSPWPAQRGEIHLHRVAGYRVDEQDRALVVDADCGASFIASAAVPVPDLGAADLCCGRCRRRRHRRSADRGRGGSS